MGFREAKGPSAQEWTWWQLDPTSLSQTVGLLRTLSSERRPLWMSVTFPRWASVSGSTNLFPCRLHPFISVHSLSFGFLQKYDFIDSWQFFKIMSIVYFLRIILISGQIVFPSLNCFPLLPFSSLQWITWLLLQLRLSCVALRAVRCPD